eukprot:6383394-Pyramimonas_sp.AAC.1
MRKTSAACVPPIRAGLGGAPVNCLLDSSIPSLERICAAAEACWSGAVSTVRRSRNVRHMRVQLQNIRTNRLAPVPNVLFPRRWHARMFCYP